MLELLTAVDGWFTEGLDMPDREPAYFLASA